MYIGCLKKTKAAKVDDPFHVSIVHGMGAMMSLATICFFHKTEGFFFKDIYTRYNNASKLVSENVKSIEEVDIDSIPPILIVLGSNSFSGFLIAIIGIALTFMSLKPL